MLWTSSLTDTKGLLRATIKMMRPTVKLSLTPPAIDHQIITPRGFYGGRTYRLNPPPPSQRCFSLEQASKDNQIIPPETSIEKGPTVHQIILPKTSIEEEPMDHEIIPHRDSYG